MGSVGSKRGKTKKRPDVLPVHFEPVFNPREHIASGAPWDEWRVLSRFTLSLKPNTKASGAAENACKNRYVDAFTVDESRVRLGPRTPQSPSSPNLCVPSGGGCGAAPQAAQPTVSMPALGGKYTDYINANYVSNCNSCICPVRATDDGLNYMTSPSLRVLHPPCKPHKAHFPCRRVYISTQAPLESTFGDFWRMVWEQDSRVIVMLTKLRQGVVVKAHCYWPTLPEDDEGRDYIGKVALDWRAGVQRFMEGASRMLQPASAATAATPIELVPLDTSTCASLPSCDSPVLTPVTPGRMSPDAPPQTPPPPQPAPFMDTGTHLVLLLTLEKATRDVVKREFLLLPKTGPYGVGELPPTGGYPPAARVVTQFHYTGWPDHEAAPDIDGFCEFIEHTMMDASWRYAMLCATIRGLREDGGAHTSDPDMVTDRPDHADAGANAGPIIVHCSAGVGRSGSFCVIHSHLLRLYHIFVDNVIERKNEPGPTSGSASLLSSPSSDLFSNWGSDTASDKPAGRRLSHGDMEDGGDDLGSALTSPQSQNDAARCITLEEAVPKKMFFNIAQTVAFYRQERVGMVQQYEQFLFCYKVLAKLSDKYRGAKLRTRMTVKYNPVDGTFDAVSH